MTVGEMKALLSEYDNDDDIECNIYLYDRFVEGQLAIRRRDGSLIRCNTFCREDIYPFGRDMLSNIDEKFGNNERNDTSMEEFMECIG